MNEVISEIFKYADGHNWKGIESKMAPLYCLATVHLQLGHGLFLATTNNGKLGGLEV